MRLSSRNETSSVDVVRLGIARSTDLPQTGQAPSFVSADGAKYLAHGSHHGMVLCSQRAEVECVGHCWIECVILVLNAVALAV
jgi:hypothetical protein